MIAVPLAVVAVVVAVLISILFENARTICPVFHPVLLRKFAVCKRLFWCDGRGKGFPRCRGCGGGADF